MKQRKRTCTLKTHSVLSLSAARWLKSMKIIDRFINFHAIQASTSSSVSGRDFLLSNSLSTPTISFSLSLMLMMTAIHQKRRGGTVMQFVNNFFFLSLAACPLRRKTIVGILFLFSGR
jgi:hypothetical protein